MMAILLRTATLPTPMPAKPLPGSRDAAERRSGDPSAPPSGQPAASAITGAIVALLGRVPETRETPLADPQARVRELSRQAARRAAAISGGLALPPGPLGVLTLVPDLVSIWKIQSQLVADIAGVHGRSGALTSEQMMYCLFRHTAAQLLRDVVVRAGERAIVHRLTVQALQSIATALGVQLTRQMLAKSASRWLPGIGAAAVAGYAWWDTERVARTAHELFSHDLVVDPDPDPPPGPVPQVEETPRGRRLRESAGAR